MLKIFSDVITILPFTPFPIVIDEYCFYNASGM
jgi:hypothetical protein